MTSTATTLTPPPPLDVVAYHVSEFMIRALDEYSREKAGRGEFEVNFDVERSETSPRDFRMVMNIEFATKGYSEEQNPPYSLRLKIAGFLTFREGVSEEQMLRMVNVNGASILYGIARGFVGQATGACQNGQFVLPAVNFIELVKVREAAAAIVAAPSAVQGSTETQQ